MRRSVARSIVTSAVIYVTYASFLLSSCLFHAPKTIRFAAIHNGKWRVFWSSSVFLFAWLFRGRSKWELGKESEGSEIGVDDPSNGNQLHQGRAGSEQKRRQK